MEIIGYIGSIQVIFQNTSSTNAATNFTLAKEQGTISKYF